MGLAAYTTTLLREKGRALGLVLVLAVTALAYFPSLFHLPRVDHWAYLEKVFLREDWYSLAVGSFALNRELVNGVPPGDELFFRPVLFFLLGNEQYFFGANFFLWQAFGILLHLLVVGALYRFLWRIRPGAQAAAVAVVFALMLANSEAVIWQHINGYVLFAWLVLLALERLYVFSVKKGRRDCLWSAAALTMAAAFCFEAGSLYALAMFFYVYGVAVIPKVRRLSFLFLAVPFIYVSLSLLNYKFMGCSPAGSEGIAGGAAGFADIVKKFFFVLKWQVSSFFFVKDDVYIMGRMTTVPQVLTWAWPFNALAWERVFALLALVSSGVWLFVCCRLKKPLNRPFLLLLASMLIGYAFFLAAGRVAPRGIGRGLVNCLYYLYDFWLLAAVFFYMLAASFEPVLSGGWRRITGSVALACLFLFAGYQAVAVYRTNQDCVVLGERFMREKVDPGSSYYKHFDPDRLRRSRYF